MTDPISEQLLAQFPYRVRVGGSELRFGSFAQALEVAGIAGPRITFTDGAGVEHDCVPLVA